MAAPERAVMERKLAFLSQFLADFRTYAALDATGRRREHYAIERLLQLLCESAADIALQVLKAKGYALASSYREIFLTLARQEEMPQALAERLVAACGMRNILTHLYDSIDLERVIAAVEPAIVLYEEFGGWARDRVAGGATELK